MKIKILNRYSIYIGIFSQIKIKLQNVKLLQIDRFKA